MTVEYRVLRTADELAELPPFEHRIWGVGDEAVSVNMLVATICEGGVAIGAYDGDMLVATAYGFATNEPGVLHSHYIAVHPDYRGQGLGEQIKYEQRVWCLDNGYTSMRWTFDPLQLTNAHLNLNKLQALGVTYHVNHYGAMGGINGGLPSDRLTVQWYLVGDRPPFRESFVLEVPPVTPEEIEAGTVEALGARLAIREQMAPHMADGFVVTAVDRHARTYTLSR
ncbi:MAG: GNAT family N-acetyltransferase [Actinomycetota bacterium]